MNVTFVSPFLSSIMNVLSTMAQMEAKAGKPFYKKNKIAHGAVTGIIGMVGKQTRGTLAISFTEPAILEITKRMLGEEETGINETVIDMTGEITNMVTGGAKNLLTEQGYKFDMATPTVISGKDHVVNHKSGTPVIVVPFKTEAGDFFIEICFED